MKPDKLEDFIRENRAGFGPGEDAPDLFSSIKKPKASEPEMTISWRRVLARAASVVAIFVASYYFHDFVSSSNANDGQAFLSKENLNSPLFKELVEADDYYTEQIKTRKEELFTLASEESGLQTDVTNELAELDEQLIDLKQDLNDNANNQEVVEAMIDNYRLKLEILEDMLEQINRKNDKKNKDESSYSI